MRERTVNAHRYASAHMTLEDMKALAKLQRQYYGRSVARPRVNEADEKQLSLQTPPQDNPDQDR